MKGEYLLPTIADGLLKNGVQFSVLSIDDNRFVVTYKEDRSAVVVSLRKLIESGLYKTDLHFEI